MESTCHTAAEIAVDICIQRIKELTWRPFVYRVEKHECISAAEELRVRCIKEARPITHQDHA